MVFSNVPGWIHLVAWFGYSQVVMGIVNRTGRPPIFLAYGVDIAWYTSLTGALISHCCCVVEMTSFANHTNFSHLQARKKIQQVVPSGKRLQFAIETRHRNHWYSYFENTYFPDVMWVCQRVSEMFQCFQGDCYQQSNSRGDSRWLPQFMTTLRIDKIIWRWKQQL